MARYSDDWETVAMAVKEAAGWKCEHCGAPHDPVVGRCLTVHHIDKDSLNNDPDNLVALCQVCHLHWQARFVPGQAMMWFGCPQWLRRRGHGD